MRGSVPYLLCLVGSFVLLNGCAVNKLPIPMENKDVVENIGKTHAQKEVERLQQCEAQLGILRNINEKQHQRYKQTFDHLMSGAAQYASLRTKVNGDIQETVDALYRYKVNYLCAGVNQAVLIGLADRGEQVK